jgi:hypothetical protein
MKKLFITIFLFFLFVFSINAQEGMWLLNQIDKLDLNKKGLQIDVNQIYTPGKPGLYSAIVQLDGGTASFVSPNGLLVTNHHVAYAALQRVASKDNNYIENGFLARTNSEEVQAQGYQARLMLEMRDVTSEVLESVKSVSDPGERADKINKKITEMSDAITKGKEDMEANIAEMYNGNQYVLFVSKVFKDVRLVYSPPLSIGNYGGETDNWMWPRHTGDFSFMRVYVAPDGTGKEYSTDNVPYKPQVWLKVAGDFIKDGDFTFIIGYPGATTRYRSSNSIGWNQNNNYPFAINNFKEIINLLEDITKNDDEGKIKVANTIKGLANVMKNYEGKVAGMKKTNFLQKRYEFENEFLNWINSSQEKVSKYGDLIAKEKKEYDIILKTKDRDNVIGIFQGLAGIPVALASQIYQISTQLAKPENERNPGLTEKNINQTIENLPLRFGGYYEPADKALFIRALKMAAQLPGDQRIKGLEYVLGDNSVSIEQFAENAFKNTKLTDVEYAKTLFRKTPSELSALNDPFINMAISLAPENEEVQKAGQKFNANVTFIRKEYMNAIYEWKGTGLYPDANGTIRFTCGPVKGYKPADAVWYSPFTTLKGVIEKNTGVEPFDAPAGLVELSSKNDFGRWMNPELKDVPVAFTHICDITGGNSGSPVMNAKGEIIGIAFDGNYEAMIGDWKFDYDLQRTISVDIHYVLFVTEKFGKAGFILDEMGVKQ